MSDTQFDLIVLGGGPGGYVAAIRAAQLGLRVAVVDEYEKFGGTCLRIGCIPSKALLESSHLYDEATRHLADHGISASQVQLDLAKMMSRKTKIVDALTSGVNMLLKRNKIAMFVGRGKLASGLKIEVAGQPQETLIARHILLAVGSIPASLPNIPVDGKMIGDSTAALSYETVPQRLVVIGGGYIGLELGSVWNRLGSQVTVLEALDRILPGLDSEIAKQAHRIFAKQGLELRTGTWVESAIVEGDQCIVQCKGSEPIRADRVLMCTGRWPNTKSIGLEAVGVAVDRRGFVVVDDDFKTNVDGVYAIGDCIGGAMLAHKASEEGVACVEKIVTGYGHVNYDAIPSIVYTNPEIASVGKTEEQLNEQGIKFNKGVCPYGANGRARTLGDIEGRVKILAHAETDRILGVHAIGIRG